MTRSRTTDRALPTAAPLPKLGDVSKLELLISKLMGYAGFGNPFTKRTPYQRQPGEGVARARQRLTERRKFNESIPDVDTPTRQRRRRSELLRGRQIMSMARQEAMNRKIEGGSAIIRRPVDVDRVLG